MTYSEIGILAQNQGVESLAVILQKKKRSLGSQGVVEMGT